jgi:toxin ParE1/3/4
LRIKLSPAARGDLLDIWNYSQLTWGSKRADEYLDDLRDRILWLTAHTNLWNQRDDLGNGLFSYIQQSHVIYFRNVEGPSQPTMEIIRILHQRMDAASNV